MFSREVHKEEQIKFNEKLINLNKYLKEVRYLAKNRAIEIFTDFDGVKRRKQININSELYVEKLRQARPFMEKLARFHEFSLNIRKVQLFVDSKIISWDLLGNANYYAQQILDTYRWFVNDTLSFDMNSRNFINSDRLSSESQESGLSYTISHTNLSNKYAYLQKHWKGDRGQMAFGLASNSGEYVKYIGGKPRHGEIRKRIFN